MPIVYSFIALFLWPVIALSGESMIVEETGQACVVEDKNPAKTDKQTILDAKTDAKRNAAARVATRIKSAISADIVEVNNAGQANAYKIAQVVQSAYVNADVKELAELKSEWFIDVDAGAGRCHRVALRVEVTPKAETLETAGSALLEDPTLPLNVRIWTDRTRSGERAVYRKGEKMRFYLRGNKPFYARVIYTSSDGQTLQVLPNPYRRNNYFQGGTLVVLPDGQDAFEMEVAEPFGVEKVTVYASERPLGELKLHPAGSVYVVEDGKGSLANQVRGIKLVPVSGSAKAETTAEFSEYSVDVITTP